jgi:hypothetical protein
MAAMARQNACVPVDGCDGAALGYLDVEVADAGFLGSGRPAARCLVWTRGAVASYWRCARRRWSGKGQARGAGAPDECDGARADNRPGVASSVRDNDIAALCV